MHKYIGASFRCEKIIVRFHSRVLDNSEKKLSNVREVYKKNRVIRIGSLVFRDEKLPG